MSADMFLKVEGIKGESVDSKHKDEIEVLSWSWGVTQAVVAHGATFGAGVADCSGGRVVGALTVSSSGSQLGVGARKNPRQPGGCTRVARRCVLLCPGRG